VKKAAPRAGVAEDRDIVPILVRCYAICGFDFRLGLYKSLHQKGPMRGKELAAKG